MAREERGFREAREERDSGRFGRGEGSEKADGKGKQRWKSGE